MKNVIVYTFLLLLIFTACEPPEDIANTASGNGQNGQNGLAKIKTYRLRYVTVYETENGTSAEKWDRTNEYKEKEWDGNTLSTYNEYGHLSSRQRYDDKGRETSNSAEQYEYRYVGDGTGTVGSNYNQRYLAIGGAKEYKESEWVGNTLSVYKSDTTLNSKITYDDKGRETSFSHFPLPSFPVTSKYRYVGDGTGIGKSNYSQRYLAVDDATEYLERKWDEENILYNYDSSNSETFRETYDGKGRLASSIIPFTVGSRSGTKRSYYRYVD